MKRLLLIAVLFPALVQAAPDLSCYNETFADTFDGTSIDLYNESTGIGTWRTMYPWCSAETEPAGCGINDELQYYVDPNRHPGEDPFTVSGGTLKITADNDSYGGYAYTSGLLTTEKSFDQTYGYFEISAKLPGSLTTSKGLWPAFWLLPTERTYWQWVTDHPTDPGQGYNRMPEADVMEWVGEGQDGTKFLEWVATLHTRTEIPGDSPTNDPQVNGWYIYGSGLTPGDDLTQGFHTYGLEWTPETMTWYYDGASVKTHATPADFTDTAINVQNQPHGANAKRYMLLNLAIGGEWPGSPNGSTAFPVSYEIDYIRAYQKSETCGAPNFSGQHEFDGYYAIYEEDIGTVPDCDKTLSATGSNWGDFDFSKRTTCLNPGDYTGRGPLTLGTSGNSTTRKWLRLAGTGNESVAQLSSGARATLSGLTVDADYWVIHRIAVDGEDRDTSNTVEFESNADYNIFNRGLVENCDGGSSGATNHCIKAIGADYLIVQNSVLRRSRWKPSYDQSGINIGGTGHRIVNNQIYDIAGDGIVSQKTGSVNGTRIENNDIYVTSAMYCENGQPNPNGTKAASENAIDMKANTSSFSNWGHILHNRFWGFKPTASSCGSSSSSGEAVLINDDDDSGNTRYWKIEGNILTGGTKFFSTPNGTPNHVSVYANWVYGNDDTAIQFSKGNNFIGKWNTVVDSSAAYLKLGGSTVDWECNVVVNSQNPEGSSSNYTGKNNAYYSSTPPSADTSLICDGGTGCKTADADSEDFTFRRKQWVGSELMSIPHGTPRVTSKHAAVTACERQ